MPDILTLPPAWTLTPYSRKSSAAARALLLEHGAASLLTPPANQTKLRASSTYTLGLSLAPADTSGVEVCPGRGECAGPCVSGYRAGLAKATGGAASVIHRARIGRTRALAADPGLILSALVWSIERAAARVDAPVAVRLNVGSDIPFERAGEFVATLRRIRSGSGAPVRLYDYTKLPARVGVNGMAAPGYRLCLSASERTRDVTLARVLEAGGNVALVVAGLRERHNAAQYTALPIPVGVTIAGRTFPTVDGDRSDDRGRDPRGRVVILRGKAGAEHIDTGGCALGDRFAVRADSQALPYRHGERPTTAPARRSSLVVLS